MTSSNCESRCLKFSEFIQYKEELDKKAENFDKISLLTDLDKLNLFINENKSLSKKVNTLEKQLAAVLEEIKHIKDQIQNLYNGTTGFEVLLIDDELGEFKVNRSVYRFGERPPSHCVIPSKRWCTCGKWQDREFPCIDGIAYF